MNLLLTGAWSDARNAIAQLEQAGHAAVFLQHECDPLPCPYDWVEGVVCNGLFLHHNIEKFPSLRFIQLISAGFDRANMEYIQKKNIEIHNARGVYSIPMAEFALCGVLQLYKQAFFFHKTQKKHLWEKNRDLKELFGQTVCIVGCGNVGTECALRFSALGCKVIGVDLYPTENTVFSQVFPLEHLTQALPKSDVVILTLPLTQESHHLFNTEVFKAFKPGSILVNIARGAVVDTSALTEALKQEILSGAVLDVFEEEPLTQDSPLWDMKNVLVTPHNSFVGNNNATRLRDIVFRNLKVLEL